MRIEPDHRFLAGGMVGAALLACVLAYVGLVSPGAMYYLPEHNVHELGDYGGSGYGLDGPTSCRDCHTQPFKDPANAGCVDCHPAGARIRLKPADPRAAKPYVNAFPQSKAGLQFHKMVEAQSCGACHAEHRQDALSAFLRLRPAERAAVKGYPEIVHGFLPREMRGEAFCATCHTALEKK